MPPPEPRQRGIAEVAESLHWRLDGAASEPQAPLLVCMHGYGMNEDYFAGLLQGLFVLPWHVVLARAPFEATDVKGRAFSWYDYDGNQERFRAELRRTDALMQEFLQSAENEAGLRPRTRFLLGFSQGGYCGAYVALNNPELFGGMIISGARVKTEILEDEIATAARHDFRVLLCHGKKDASVTLEAAERSLQGLRSGGVETQLSLFDSGHAVGRTQVNAMREWLSSTA